MRGDQPSKQGDIPLWGQSHPTFSDSKGGRALGASSTSSKRPGWVEGVGDRGRLGYLGHQDNLYHRRKIHGCVCYLLSRLDFAEHLSMPGRTVPVRSCKLMGSKLLKDNLTEEQTGGLRAFSRKNWITPHQPWEMLQELGATHCQRLFYGTSMLFGLGLRIACASRACF